MLDPVFEPRDEATQSPRARLANSPKIECKSRYSPARQGAEEMPIPLGAYTPARRKDTPRLAAQPKNGQKGRR